jgi:penicillin amidase
VVYADVEGNIAYQTPGRIPIRASGDGLAPAPGWTGESEWQDEIPYEELPAAFNPRKGYIVTANNAVTEEGYPYFISYYWADGDRAKRISEMIEAAIDSGVVTTDDFARIQMDGKSLLAESYIPLLQGLSSQDSRVQAVIERLRGWDLQTDRSSVPAALFEVFTMQLARAALADELGSEVDDYLANSGGTQRVFLHQLATQPDARWWDNVDTAEEEGREDIIRQALADTVTWFEDNVGGDMEGWTWGELHTATFVSDPLGKSGNGLLERVVNRGPYAVSGTTSAVNATSWSWDDVAAVGGHPSMRMIVDMANLDESRTIHPTGQSGHPFHPHYDDFIQLWINGEYHPMLFSRQAVEEASAEELLLQPAQ